MPLPIAMPNAIAYGDAIAASLRWRGAARPDRIAEFPNAGWRTVYPFSRMSRTASYP
jgi:hypothetical protein